MSPAPAKRCAWPGDSELQLDYHDSEWGVPLHDDVALFEFLTLEGAQAGLSWDTILKKREGYRKAFACFDAAKVARFTPARVEKLMQDPSIVRNRMKIESMIDNATAVLRMQREYGSLDAYLWSFMPNGEPIQHRFERLEDLPAQTPESKAMSKQLKKDGFRFVGPTTIYAFMQAVGMVNDHTTDCFRHRALGGKARRA